MVKIINKLKNKKGFTLIELIVVLAVLGIIMAIAVPRFAGVKETAKVDADEATLGLIAKMAEFYYVQGTIDNTFEGKDIEIGSDNEVEKAFAADFPTFELQSVDGETLEKVTININKNTGKAIAKYDDLSSDN